MSELWEYQWPEFIAIWSAIALGAGIMVADRLRGFSRELFASRKTADSQPIKTQRQNQSRVQWAWPALMLVVPSGLAIEFIVEHIIAMAQR